MFHTFLNFTHLLFSFGCLLGRGEHLANKPSLLHDSETLILSCFFFRYNIHTALEMRLIVVDHSRNDKDFNFLSEVQAFGECSFI